VGSDAGAGALPGGDDIVVPLDLSAIPKELHEQAKALHEKINNDHKRNYTQKYQTLAAKEKEYVAKEQKWLAEKAQADSLKERVLDCLKDPTGARFREIQARLGFGGGQASSSPSEEDEPVPQTVGEMIAFMDRKIDRKVEERLAAVRGYADQVTVSAIEADKRQRRWEAAESEVASDPVFTRYAEAMTHMALNNPKYRAMYDGFNESVVMKAVLRDFKDLRNADIEAERQALLADLEKKKAASSLPPTNGALSGALARVTGEAKSDDDIRQEVRRKYGFA
jgi:hypothetical protein